ncbi:MAG: Beta-barrel assembly-enhancing protease [Opitutia bacterium UBA7350]|nr:MAG: Beta-barrel assembly-enhancing protease [Opitutae bacterium UBA7350]
MVSRIITGFIGLASLYFVACTTVPVTGRKALHIYSEADLVFMAASQFQKLKQETARSTDPEINARVQRVGSRIARIAAYDLPNVKWEFVVFEDPDQINAFAMPGGKVAIYTGLFKVIESDADLAVVIGHEVAHVVARHAAERISHQMLVKGGSLAVAVGTSDMDAADRRSILAGLGIGTTVGVLLPYSRLHECEADAIGILYTAEAGYDPRVAIDFWQRMAAQKSSSPPEFLSTHPTDSTRVSKLESLMPQAVAIYEAGL